MESLVQMENTLEVTCSWVTPNKSMILSSIHPRLRPIALNLMDRIFMAAYSEMLMEVKVSQRKMHHRILQLLFPPPF
jgi:hypothetical protein